MCYIDYTKAFDKIRHLDLFGILQNLDIDGKDIRFLLNLYWDQTTAIRIEGNVGRFVTIQSGVCQGCVFSPDHFNIYSEHALRKVEDIRGIVIGGHNINNIRYADNTALIAESEEKSQQFLSSVQEESLNKNVS